MSVSRQPDQTIRATLTCGTCGRVLDKLVCDLNGHPEIGVPVAQTTYQWKVKPSVRRENHARDGERATAYYLTSDGPGRYDGRRKYTCHRRCGAVHVIRIERLTAAVVAAHRAGRDRIVAGVDT